MRARFGVLAVMLLGGTLALLSGCGNEGGGDAATPATTTVVVVTTQAVTATSASPTESVTTEKAEPATTEKAKPVPEPAPAPVAAKPRPDRRNVALRKYFKENFGGAFNPAYKVSWYDYIKAINGPDEFGLVTIKTNIYPDSDATEPAGAMCLAIMLSDIDGVTSGEILGTEGATLDSCP